MSSFIPLLRKRLSAADTPEEGIRPIHGNYEVIDFIDTVLDLKENLSSNYTLWENHQGCHIDQYVIDFAEGLGFDAGDVKRTPGDMYVEMSDAYEVVTGAITFLNRYFAKEGCNFMYHPEIGSFGHYALEQEYHLVVVASPDEKAYSYEAIADAFKRYPSYSTISIEGHIDMGKQAHIIPLKMIAASKSGGFQDIATIMGTIGYKNILIHINTDE